MTTHRSSGRNVDYPLEVAVETLALELHATAGCFVKSRGAAALDMELNSLRVRVAAKSDVDLVRLDTRHLKLEFEHMVFYVPEEVAADAVDLGRSRLVNGEWWHAGER